MQKPSHFSSDGNISMVDVSGKAVTQRVARAEAVVHMGTQARAALQEAALAKGDAFAVAQIAGIMAAKRTDTLIPLAHSLPLAKVDVRFEWMPDDALRVESVVRTLAQTGVEMEALVAVSIAALTIYDMTKALDKGVTIEHVRLLEKTGGKSGTWQAK